MAKDITLKTRNGETRYPKTVTAIVYENGTGKTLQTIIDEMRQVDADTNTRTRHFKADVNNLDTLKNKTDIGLYNYVGTGWRGSVSVCYDSADNVSQVALSSSTPSYNGNTLTWISAQPCAMARTYKNGAWSHWEKVGAPVVNDLTTGGTDKALSAEMGKTLKEGMDALGPKIDKIGSMDSLFVRASSPAGSMKLPMSFGVGKTYYLHFEVSQSATFAITLRSADYASGPIAQTIAASKSYNAGKHIVSFTYLDGTYLRLGESAVWSSITNISIYNSINDVVPSIQKEVVEVSKVADNFEDATVEDEELKSVVGAYFNAKTEIDTSFTSYKAHYYKYNPLREYTFTSTNIGGATSHVFFVDEDDKVIGRAFPCSSTSSTYTNEPISDIPALTACIVLQTSASSSTHHLYHESKVLKASAIPQQGIEDGSVTTQKLSNGAVTNEKIADNSIAKAKLGFSLDNATPSLGLGRLNNLFQFDGITEDGGTNIFPNNDGNSITPIVSRDSTFANPLGLKWVVTLTPKDALYNGAYYGSPYIGMNFYGHVTDKKKITFGYWIDITISNYNPNVYISLTGSYISVAILHFTTNSEEVVTKSEDGVYAATSKFVKYKYRGHDWAYCQIQLSVDATYNNTQLGMVLQVKGGEDNIGKKYPFCGFVAINDIVELDAWTYYPSVDNLLYKIQELAQSSEIPTLSEAKIGTAGDSITEGAGLKADDDVIPNDDIFCPISGTKKKTFGYYIARELFAHWYNYGNSGSTLGNVTARNASRNGFSVSRYQNMSDDLTYITIWFGWNDAAYGPEMMIEEWIESQFGTRKAWTNDSSKYDTLCAGNLYYCSEEEHDAVVAYSEAFDGVTYTGTSAFVMKYIGTPTDSSNKTWWGAWNTVLPYLVAKYPNAKILVITGYGGNAAMWDAAIAAAKKYGVGYLDLSESGSMNFIQRRNTSNESNGQVYFDATKYTDRDYFAEYSSGNVTASEFRKRTLLYDACHPNTFGYQYLYKRIMQKMISI